MKYNSEDIASHINYVEYVFEKHNIDLLKALDIIIDLSSDKNNNLTNKILDFLFSRLVLHPSEGVIFFKSNLINESMDTNFIKSCKIGSLILLISYQNSSIYLKKFGMIIFNIAMKEIKKITKTQKKLPSDSLRDLVMCLSLTQKINNNKNYNGLIKNLIEIHKSVVNGNTTILQTDLHKVENSYNKLNVLNKNLNVKKLILYLLNKSFKRTMLFLNNLISIKKQTELIDSLLTEEVSNYASRLQIFIESLKDFISIYIVDQLKDLYIYERAIWEFNLSFTDRKKLIFEEIELEKYKYSFFGLSNREFLSTNIVINKRFLKLETNWKWIQNCVTDIKEINPSEQILIPSGSFINGLVISGFSNKGYFEYSLSDYDVFILNLFSDSSSIKTNYKVLTKKFNVDSKKDKLRVLETLRVYIDKLLDRNIMIIKPCPNRFIN